MDSSIQRGKVRVVARIRGFGDQVPATAPSISIRKLQTKSPGSDRVLISFSGEQSSTSNKPFNYEVDHCYDHEASNDAIFIEEIKPLISSVFEGKSATVFAYGARGSGKTYTIQGSENVAGLMTLSMSEFLSRAEEVGNCISFSLYEVVQDHVFDLLDSKKPEISVLEGAHGKVILKGLSKVIVKSMSDFKKSCFAIIKSPLQKMANEPPQRSHRGMIINVVTSMKNASLLGRMNLVDLAGYEDKKQSTNGPSLLEISRINKSLYATHNVLHALKNNETHVPYRESKLTRMLQGSLGGMNKILMITCLDPSFSEDTIKALSLASRSCHVGDKTKVDHSSRVRSLIKPTMTPTSSSKQTAALSSKNKVDHSSGVRSLIKPTMTPSSTKQTAALSSKMMKVARSSVSASTRKQAKSLFHDTEEKPEDVEAQGRRLFQEQQSDNKNEDTLSETNMEVTEPSRVQEEKMCDDNVSESALVVSANGGEDYVVSITESSLAVSTDEVSSPTEKTGVHTPSVQQPVSRIPTEQVVQDNLVSETPIDHHHSLVTPDIDVLQADKENKGSALNEGPSPPLSVRLQELSNSLKSLYTSTPLNKKMELETYSSIKGNDQLGNDLLEPSTPMSQPSLNANSKCKYTSLMSPWERLQIHSTGMKDSLVKECLTFLNSASKEELKGLKGIGEARANYIMDSRDEEPFKTLEDLKVIGLSSKQINGMMKTVAGGLFD